MIYKSVYIYWKGKKGRQVARRYTINKSAESKKYVLANIKIKLAYIGNKQYKNSIVSANKFIADNQDDTKVPDALRIIYVSQHNLGLKKEANKTLETLNTKYPNSEALKKIQQ